MTERRDIMLSPDEQALKGAAKALVRAAGGVEAAGELVGKGKTALSNYGLPNVDVFMPIDVVAALEAVTYGRAGHPHVTRMLARRTGHVLVALPPAPGGSHDWHGGMGVLAKEAGEITSAICQSLADDGVVDATEARAIVAKCEQAAAALMAIKAMALSIGSG